MFEVVLLRGKSVLVKIVDVDWGENLEFIDWTILFRYNVQFQQIIPKTARDKR